MTGHAEVGRFGVNLTGKAQPVLLKNSPRSRPQGRNGDYSATCLDLIFVDECVGDLASSEGGAICTNQPRRLEPKSIAHNQLGNLLHYAVIFGGGKLIKRTVRIDGSFDCMFYPVDLDLSEVLFQV